MSSSPPVTLGIVAGEHADALYATLSSCLAQGSDMVEVLLAVGPDGAPPDLTSLPGLRVLPCLAKSIPARRNALLADARGELIAMLDPGEVLLAGGIQRALALFRRRPETAVVHGDATVLGPGDRQLGTLAGIESSAGTLRRRFWRTVWPLVPATAVTRRSVLTDLGGYDERFAATDRFELLQRASERHAFSHIGGAPVMALGREAGWNAELLGEEELAETQRALTAALDRASLRDLVPELDWAVLEPPQAERQALLLLADLITARPQPLAELAERLRERATAIPPVRRSAPTRGRLLITSFGFNDSGGGTTVPRLAAKELVRRGWEVTVFSAATRPTSSGAPYELSEHEIDGVRVIGVHNRPHGLFDLGHPERERDDPTITAAFAAELDGFRPNVVHFHNLHNLGAALIDETLTRGIPSCFTTHNYWLICPRAYLMDGTGAICAGPGDGARCAACVGSHDPAAHQQRLSQIRAVAERGLGSILAVSDAVRAALIGAGYNPSLVDVVRQAMPQEREIWETLGRDRPRGRSGEKLVVAFLGSAYPHKGPQLLLEAAQRTEAEIEVRILGEVPPHFARALRAADRRGVLTIEGAFSPSEIPSLLARVDAAVLPSLWWDCAPLAAAECLAAGTPVIVPRLGGLPEAITDGVDGLSFAGGDAADLARQLDRLASDEGLLERLQAGIREPRSFAAYVDELEAYYAGKRPGRRRDTPRATPPAVRWQGDHGLPTSLSIINDRVIQRLGGPVQRVAIDGRELDRPLPHPAQVEVRHQWPPDLSPARSGRLALIQPWEFGAIPSSWIGPLQANVDELWVPSEYVRAMYLSAGLDPARVTVIPNGVDLQTFSPAPEPRVCDELRFLFVGGLIPRKGPDLLLNAYLTAFPERADVTLVVKDFGADGIYRDGDRARFAEHVASGALPRVELVDDVLSSAELAELYRGCDVLVAPYRGEGFCMPALEAMACGLPVIATGGGPTDEFVPVNAGWRIASQRRMFPDRRVAQLETYEQPWMLEPIAEDLVRCLRDADECGVSGRRARGVRARRAAETLSWDMVADRYRAAIDRLAGAAAPLRSPEPWPLEGEAAIRVLATPAWRGEDRLGELLAAWSRITTRDTDACLYLLADPSVDGDPAELEARVLSAAAGSGADIDGCADIDVVMAAAGADRDRRVHAAVDGYVPLHAACAGHVRMALAAGNPLLAPEPGELSALLTGAEPRHPQPLSAGASG